MDYKNGKIYSIRSHQTDKFYIGSTTQPLSKRLSAHKAHFRAYLDGKYHKVTSFDIIEYGDAYIELLEECPCETKDQLHKREGECIRAEPSCVNKVVAGRTKKEYMKTYCADNADKKKEYSKQYREQNADKIKQYKEQNADKIKEHLKTYYANNADKFKQYYADNADKIKEQTKQYRENNADKIKEQTKQYRENNADKIKEQQKQYRERKKMEQQDI